MLTNLSKAKFELQGEKGLPENFPVPVFNENTLFYIQRNLNTNTVVYEVNKLHDGSINSSLPMHPYWIKYSLGGEEVELNFIQNKLAFGYESEEISKELYEFRMVSYKKIRFFLNFDQKDQKYRVITNINGKKAFLNNIYVYAEELGLFPDMKYFELYGTDCVSALPTYEKIIL